MVDEEQQTANHQPGEGDDIPDFSQFNVDEEQQTAASSAGLVEVAPETENTLLTDKLILDKLASGERQVAAILQAVPPTIATREAAIQRFHRFMSLRYVPEWLHIGLQGNGASPPTLEFIEDLLQKNEIQDHESLSVLVRAEFWFKFCIAYSGPDGEPCREEPINTQKMTLSTVWEMSPGRFLEMIRSINWKIQSVFDLEAIPEVRTFSAEEYEAPAGTTDAAATILSIMAENNFSLSNSNLVNLKTRVPELSAMDSHSITALLTSSLHPLFIPKWLFDELMKRSQPFTSDEILHMCQARRIVNVPYSVITDIATIWFEFGRSGDSIHLPIVKHWWIDHAMRLSPNAMRRFIRSLLDFARSSRPVISSGSSSSSSNFQANGLVSRKQSSSPSLNLQEPVQRGVVTQNRSSSSSSNIEGLRQELVQRGVVTQNRSSSSSSNIEGVREEPVENGLVSKEKSASPSSNPHGKKRSSGATEGESSQPVVRKRKKSGHGVSPIGDISLRVFVLKEMLIQPDITIPGLMNKCRISGLSGEVLIEEALMIRYIIVNQISQPMWFHELLASSEQVSVEEAEAAAQVHGDEIIGIEERIRVWRKYCLDGAGWRRGGPPCEPSARKDRVNMTKRTITNFLKDEIENEKINSF
jgi:hypothetical protein